MHNLESVLENEPHKIFIIIIIIISFLSLWFYLLVSHWGLIDSMSALIFINLLIILANFISAGVWRILILPLSSNLPTRFTDFLGSIPRAPPTIGIIINSMFLIFFSALTRYRYLTIFSLSLISTQWSTGATKSTWWQVLLFLIIKLGLIWSGLVLSHINLCRLFNAKSIFIQ